MSWQCPKCDRTFKHRMAEHSCKTISVESHFERKDPRVRATFAKLLAGVREFGHVTVNSLRYGILVKAASTFLVIKPKKSHLDVEFILPDELREFPIYRSLRSSKNRVAHFMVLERPRDVSKHLLQWLKQSYRLVSGEIRQKSKVNGQG